MKNRIQSLSSYAAALVLLSACGGGSSGGGGSNNLTDRERRSQEDEQREEVEIAELDGSNIQGRYLAKFSTLNSIVVGTIPGSAQFLRRENQLDAYVRLFAGSPDIAHFQNVHTGSRCPTMKDDTNNDGFIDYQEAIAVIGPVIIPLDWDISSQLSANRSWPKAFPNGSYEYLKSASFDRFWDDLKGADKNPNDNIVKIAEDQGLILKGRVVMVQGVAADKILPDSVAGFGRWRNYQTLPIACGVLKATNEESGTPYVESIPGPVGPVVEGQDQPAPEGSGEIPGTGTVITGGPSNDAGSNDSGSETDVETTPTPAPVPMPEPMPEPAPIPEDEDEDEEEDDGGFCWPWESDCR